MRAVKLVISDTWPRTLDSTRQSLQNDQQQANNRADAEAQHEQDSTAPAPIMTRPASRCASAQSWRSASPASPGTNSNETAKPTVESGTQGRRPGGPIACASCVSTAPGDGGGQARRSAGRRTGAAGHDGRWRRRTTAGFACSARQRPARQRTTDGAQSRARGSRRAAQTLERRSADGGERRSAGYALRTGRDGDGLGEERKGGREAERGLLSVSLCTALASRATNSPGRRGGCASCPTHVCPPAFAGPVANQRRTSYRRLRAGWLAAAPEV
jgi:hypothetical protein